jgi:UDP-N-acetylmuramoylalanine--D-glutamate ligase
MNGHNAVVLGLGASGEAAARLLRAEGWSVAVVDANRGSATEARAAALRAEGVSVRLGADARPEGPLDLAVASPGIPARSPWLDDLRRRGVPILSEMELGWSRHRGRTLAVTGSNGKSTAVKWLAEAWSAAGRRVAIAGNYGPPVSAVVLAPPQVEWLVLEVSSFQLETVESFRPGIGVLMNIYPNHLDRHGDFETYRALKWRLFSRMEMEDVAIVPAAWRREFPRRGPRVIAFGADGENAEYIYRDGRVWREGCAVLDVRGTWFDNPVMGLTAAAVTAAAEAGGVAPGPVEQTARLFQPLPHRMALVAEMDGVRYVDDSKSTNVAALAAALRMTRGPVRLIAGGKPKGEDYGEVAKILSEQVVKVYLIGMAASAMARAWSEGVPCELCGTLESAVERARCEARSGETVLLSPGCASFDQFQGYDERGEQFVQCIRSAEKFTKKKATT